jgi:adenylate kinase family enzyme
MKKVELLGYRDIIIIHGPPGAGKGTMSDRFASEHPHANHISAGDTVRDILSGTIESRNADSLISLSAQGLLMPGDMSTDVMFEAIGTNSTSSLYLIDGYPQRKSELDTLLVRASQEKVRIIGALCLEVSSRVSIERMERRGLRKGETLLKNDDALSYFRQRYERFMQTYPAIKTQLADSMNLVELDASDDEPVVYDKFKKIISQSTQE